MYYNILVGLLGLYQIFLSYLIWRYKICQVSYQWLRKHIVVIAVSALSVLFLVTFIFVAIHIIPSFNMAQLVQTELSPPFNPDIGFKNYITAQMEYVRGTFTLVAALVGILVLMKSFFALDLDREKATLEETKAQNERFAKAIEHLGNDAIDIRLGGIFALEALMNENPERFASRVITQLCAYSSNKGIQLNNLWEVSQQQVKEEKQKYEIDYEEWEEIANDQEIHIYGHHDGMPDPPQKPKNVIETLYHLLKKMETKAPSIPPFSDIEEVVRIIHPTKEFSTHAKNVFWYGIDLGKGKIFLNGCTLPEVDFSGISTALKDLPLSGLKLWKANLSSCDLTNTDLSKSELTETNLWDCTLDRTTFFEAIIRESSFADCYFLGADLSKANILYSNFSGADFSQSPSLENVTMMKGCCFYGATLSSKQVQLLKKWENCIPSSNFSILKSFGHAWERDKTDIQIYEQDPKKLTDDEVKQRLQLKIMDDEPSTT
jgi:hypothetical protein